MKSWYRYIPILFFIAFAPVRPYTKINSFFYAFAKAITIIVLVFNCGGKALSAQTQESKRAPIPIEVMLGQDKINYLGILNLGFGENSKLSCFGVISALAPYDNEDANNELVITNYLTYEFTKNFFATGGAQYHYTKGVIPLTGVQFLSANPNWLVLINPSIHYAPTTNFEGVGIVEFKPKLSDKSRLYTRLQTLFNYNLSDDLNDRSFVYLRTGITINKTSFGVGMNLDFYGKQQMREETFGLFIQHLF